ncbi:MAG: TIGR02757 family protein [Bacteroidetes bacterium]|nr:TIGR02757 family protein [Bacteroidota bacterium]
MHKIGVFSQETIDLLNEKYLQYNQPNFIENDPILIPHRYSRIQDIEISGFFAATLAWGQRKTIIKKCEELLEAMDHAPFDFIMNHSVSDLKLLQNFVHRTFNFTDLLYFIEFFKNHYSKFDSLEYAFMIENIEGKNIRINLMRFKEYFFSLSDFPHRTTKHISTPANHSACKRLNMFLRWMVRKDRKGVDFGIWKNLKTSQLICPCDVHVEKTARILGLTQRPKADWHMAEEITENLKFFDPLDPVKYDFALFGMGIENYFSN